MQFRCLFGALLTLATAHAQTVVIGTVKKDGKHTIDTLSERQMDSLKGVQTRLKAIQESRRLASLPPRQYAYGPDYEPTFRTVADSAVYTGISRLLREGFKNRAPIPHLDSLLEIQRHVREDGGITGWRAVYAPLPGFTPFDSLTQGSTRTTVRKLSLSNYSGKKLPPALFECPNISELELVNTAIKKLPRKLNKLQMLRTVYIRNNQVQHLRLRRNTRIVTLVARSASPGTLPARYTALKNLNKLDLAGNRLRQFPLLGRTEKLRELNLSNNEIDLTNSVIKPAPDLEKLTLQYNNIREVPASIGNLSGLKRLMFNYNVIAVVSDGISRLKNLEELSFYNNKLTSVPAGLYSLEKLKQLDLYYNQIERLDDQTVNWKNLTVLFLSNNGLFSLPDNLGALRNLQELYLHNNRLSSLPESIGNLMQLRVLRINNNYLPQLPARLTQLKTLENLDISHNDITSLPDGLFGLDRLQLLNLVDNPWDGRTKDEISTKAALMRDRHVIVNTDQD